MPWGLDRRSYSRFQFRSKIPYSMESFACGICPCACGIALHIAAFPAQFKNTAILYDVTMSAKQGRKAPYSADMRWRMVWQRFGMELTYTKISERLNVAVSTVHSTCKKFENTGDVQSSKQPLRPQSHKLDENHERLLLAILIETPTLYLHEMCKHILDTIG